VTTTATPETTAQTAPAGAETPATPATPAVTVDLAQLIRALNAACQFVAENYEVVGSLRAVIVDAHDGLLTATSTNRYVIAQASAPATGSLPAALCVAGEYLQLAVDALRLVPDLGYVKHVRIDASATRMSMVVIDHDGGTIAVVSAPFVSDTHWPYETSTAVLAAAENVTTRVGEVDLAGEWIQKLAKLTANMGTMQLRLGEHPKAPVHVTIGDWLTALVMPCDPGGRRTSSRAFRPVHTETEV